MAPGYALALNDSKVRAAWIAHPERADPHDPLLPAKSRLD